MHVTQRAKELLEALSEEWNDSEKVRLLAEALIRATSDVCQVCQTGLGNGRGKSRVLCALCRKEPEIIVCYDCARKTTLPSWGS